MSSRLVDLVPEPPAAIIRHPQNWMGVICFGLLSTLHFALALAAGLPRTWESHVSAVFGALFATIAILYFLHVRELAIYIHRQAVGVIRGIGPVVRERLIPFSDIECVRVVLPGVGSKHEAAVSIVTRNGEIELPPSPTPRQDALALAMITKARLVKIYTDPAPAPAKRLDRLFGRQPNHEDVQHDE